MTCTLTVCEGENNERTISNPSLKMIKMAIDDLIPEIFHFVILEADPPVEDCVYMQARIPGYGKMKGRYLVEARFTLANGPKHYRKHVEDADGVKGVFQAFARGVAPDIAGWDDITGKVTGNGNGEEPEARPGQAQMESRYR